jgi:hypothetical protein
MKSQSLQAIQPAKVPVKINGNISYKKRREELNEVVKRHVEMKKQTQKHQE